MNNFIVSEKGFLKSIDFNKETKVFDIKWTKVLREAQRYNSKPAVNLLKKKEINGFIWNPYKEEPIRGKWEVVQRKSGYSFDDKELHKALEWKPEKVLMESKTDLGFLLSDGVERKVYYDSYAEALEICQVKNLEIIKELQEKMEKMVKI